VKQNFDAAGWVAAIGRAVESRGITWRQVGEATGVSDSTLSRMKDGRHPDAASLAALSAWAGINPADYCPKVPQPILCPHCLGTGRMMPNGSVIADKEKP
jgi:transcriptional regulator with XRE-family HTH domain